MKEFQNKRHNCKLVHDDRYEALHLSVIVTRVSDTSAGVPKKFSSVLLKYVYEQNLRIEYISTNTFRFLLSYKRYHMNYYF